MGEVALLLGLQVGVGLLGAGILAVLPFDTGSGSWMGGVAVLVGSQTYVMIKEKRRPGGTAPIVHGLALWAALGQLVLGALFFAGAALLVPEAAAELRAAPHWLGVLAVLVPLLVYAMTRFGLRMGLKNVQAARPK